MADKSQKTFTGSKSADQALAGIAAGAVTTSILHPLDLLKVRLQMVEVGRGQTYKISQEIIRKEGIRALYRGISPNIVGATASWGLYFLLYSEIKDMQSSGEKLGAHQNMLASAVAG